MSGEKFAQEGSAMESKLPATVEAMMNAGMSREEAEQALGLNDPERAAQLEGLSQELADLHEVAYRRIVETEQGATMTLDEATRKVLTMLEDMHLCWEFVNPATHDDFLEACDDVRRELAKRDGSWKLPEGVVIPGSKWMFVGQGWPVEVLAVDPAGLVTWRMRGFAGSNSDPMSDFLAAHEQITDDVFTHWVQWSPIAPASGGR